MNGQVLKKILLVMQQKISPLLQRRVHSNLQDLSLLFSNKELENQPFKQSSSYELTSKLPFMTSDQLMIRWVRHILRSHLDNRIKYGLEQKFRERFLDQQVQTAKLVDGGSPKKDSNNTKLNFRGTKDTVPRSKSVNQISKSTADKDEDKLKKINSNQEALDED